MLTGAYPPAGPAGTLYQANDSLQPLWFNDAGTWRPMIDGHLGTAPVGSDFTTSIGTLATKATSNGVVLVTVTGEGLGGTYNIQGVGRALSTAVGARATCCLSTVAPTPTLSISIYYGTGIYVARTLDSRSASGLLVSAGNATHFPAFKAYAAAGNPTTNNDLRPGCDVSHLGRPMWFQAVRPVAGTLLLQASYDGLQWQTLGTVAEGKDPYDRVGIMGLVHDVVSSAEQIRCHSWVQV